MLILGPSAITALSDPSILDWISQGGAYVLAVFIIWSGVIKSPPLWVTYREHERCENDLARWEQLALRGTDLADAAANAIDRNGRTLKQ